MDKIEVIFYKNGEEVEIDDIPDDYVRGIIEACKSSLNTRGRVERVFSKIAQNVAEKSN